jgi:hypothetical protein
VQDRQLAAVLRRHQCLLYRGRKLHEREVPDIIEIVLTAFVNNPNKTVRGSSVIGDDLVDLPQNPRRLVVGIVNAQCEPSFAVAHTNSISPRISNSITEA